MRAIGVVLFLAGLGLGFLWPWAQLNFGGSKFDELKFTQLRNGGEVLGFNVTKADNPLRIRFQIKYLVGATLPPQKIPMKVLITDREGALLTGVISFSTHGIDAGPEQGTIRGSKSLNFEVLNAGEHQLALSLAPNPNDGGIARPDIDTVTATVVANAPALNDDYKALAAVLSLLGFYLFMRSRRRRNNDGEKAPPPKWGRGE